MLNVQKLIFDLCVDYSDKLRTKNINRLLYVLVMSRTRLRVNPHSVNRLVTGHLNINHTTVMFDSDNF